uniref:Uncharacterized protein n=1 Tax=Rhizophora mucronata TaxID=61149 RepID=A0A2P2QTB5_RHIMU
MSSLIYECVSDSFWNFWRFPSAIYPSKGWLFITKPSIECPIIS